MKTLRLLLLLLLPLAAGAQTSNPYGIYPVPHKTVQTSTAAEIADEVTIVAEEGIDSYTLARAETILSEHGKRAVRAAAAPETGCVLLLGVHGSGGVADSEAPDLESKNGLFTLAKYDRHYLSIAQNLDGSGARILIVGENTDATFCGLASLEQMLDQNPASLRCGSIQDYADIKDRGIIEGYYGVPYSAEVTKDLFRFMARYKMNMYMYGAKSDPYHSQYWSDPYPTSITEEQRKLGYLSQQMLREITDVAHECKVNFIWAIHPGSAFTNSSNTSVVTNILKKFEAMYALGVRQFGVFVDDVGVPSDDATLKLNADRVTQIQNRIDAKWNTPDAAPADTVKPLNFVPQLYALSWASAENCRKFYGALASTPSKVNIYITGNAVWTVPNSTDLSTAKSYLGREVSWWWNYPCNDNDATKLFPMDTYSNFADETHISSSARLEKNLQGTRTLISNPMQQGEVSKIALFSIADYAWNNSAFNNAASWEAAFPAVVSSDYAAALRRLAPYLRYYDSSAFASLVTRYKSAFNGGQAQLDVLDDELSALSEACATLHGLETSPLESDRLFWEDLSPWLLKLEALVGETQALLTVAAMDDGEDSKWEKYVGEQARIEALDADERFNFNVLTGLGSGISLSVRGAEPAQQSLAPFVDWLKENALGKSYFTAPTLSRPVYVSSRDDLRCTVSYQAATATAFIVISQGATLEAGDYIGMQLVQATRLADITLADTLFDAYEILTSADGKRWFTLQRGEVPTDFVKYVVIKNNTSSPRLLKLGRNDFVVKLPTPLRAKEATVPEGTEFYSGHNASYMADGDYSTWTCINRNQQVGDAYTLTLPEVTTITDVRICMGTTNDDYMTAGRVQVSEDGKQWKNLPIKGTSTTTYTLSHKNNVKYSDEMTYCDFDGRGLSALYVRLYVATANTSKWLRLYEIEVNGRSYEAKFQSLAVDADGNNLPEVTDAAGYTRDGSNAKTKAGAVTYFFRATQPLEAVTIYSASAEASDARVSITTDGTTWEELGELSGNVARYDLSKYPLATALRISWETASPEICEISERTNSEERVVVSDISFLDAPTSAEMPFDLSEGTLRVKPSSLPANVEVYSLEGRRLLSAAVPAAGLRLPLPSGKIFILRYTRADGLQLSCKLCVR